MRRVLALLLPVLVLAACGGGDDGPRSEAVPLPQPPDEAEQPPDEQVGVGARKRLIVAVGDQRPATFSDPEWRALRLRHSRLIVPWNGISDQPEVLDKWLSAARAARVEPLVAFNHARTDRCPQKPCRPPSVAQYRRAFRAFRAKYPWVRTFAPWNEANHQSQPVGKNPRRAAEYYNVVRAACRGCRIVAADLLDSSNMRRWLRTFMRTAKKPTLWGLHNYSDTNRFRDRGTRTLLKLVKGEVWLTETGGVVSFTTATGKVALAYNESRASRSVDFVFKLAAIDPKRIRRIYLYQWRKTNSFDRFDSGLVRPSGRPRPSLNVLRRRLGLKPLTGVVARSPGEAAAEEAVTIAPSESSTEMVP